MVHEVADDDRVLSARADIDAAMARGMPRRRGKPKHVVKRKVVVDQQRLPGRNHRLTVESPDVPGWIVPALGRFLPRGVFAFVKHVFCLWEGWHPASVAEQGIPTAVVDVQVRAKDVVDVVEPQTGGAEPLQPRLL